MLQPPSRGKIEDLNDSFLLNSGLFSRIDGYFSYRP
jgi:hypothetical protein